MVKTIAALLRHAHRHRYAEPFYRTKCSASAGWTRCCSKDDRPSHAACADLSGDERCPQTGKIHRVRDAGASIFIRLNSADAKPREIAWLEFHQRYAPIIAGFAQIFGARAQDVDDVIQDVLLGFDGQSPTFIYDPSRQAISRISEGMHIFVR